jgi:tetratricopeptide (TPR) repeat protein
VRALPDAGSLLRGLPDGAPPPKLVPPDAAAPPKAGPPDAAIAPKEVPPDAALPALLRLDAMAFVPPPDAPPPAVPVPKRELDALLEHAGEPLAPESCRVTDAATLKRLEEAARALYPKGDSFGALAALGDAPGDHAEEWALRARAQLPNDAARALISAQEAARLCPTYAVAHNLAGNALQKMGKLDQAEEAYERALWEVPAYDPPRFNLGLVQLRRKDPSAVWTFTELVKRRPDYPNVYLVRAQAYLLKGDRQAAIADLEEAVRRNPDSAEAKAALEQMKKAGKKD